MLSLKVADDGETKYMAKDLEGAHREKLRSMTLLFSQVLQSSSVRLFLVFSSVFEFEVWTANTRQSRLQ